jgi:hypothetical protein
VRACCERADEMTVEICKPGGEQAAEWMRYVIGQPHEGNPPLDVLVKLPRSTEMISRPEVFEAGSFGSWGSE